MLKLIFDRDAIIVSMSEKNIYLLRRITYYIKKVVRTISGLFDMDLQINFIQLIKKLSLLYTF